jgi:hypothetical protein
MLQFCLYKKVRTIPFFAYFLTNPIFCLFSESNTENIKHHDKNFFYTNTDTIDIPSTNSEVIIFLRQHRILRSEIHCSSCSHTMRETIKKNTADGYVFRCTTKECLTFATTRSIRSGSFLENYNITLKKFLYFLFEMSCETPQKDIIYKVGISHSLC